MKSMNFGLFTIGGRPGRRFAGEWSEPVDATGRLYSLSTADFRFSKFSRNMKISQLHTLRFQTADCSMQTVNFLANLSSAPKKNQVFYMLNQLCVEQFSVYLPNSRADC